MGVNSPEVAQHVEMQRGGLDGLLAALAQAVQISQGPTSQQNTGGSGSNGLHPQKLVQSVGFRDSNTRKHEGVASLVTVLSASIVDAVLG
jgi:hypothetical protein